MFIGLRPLAVVPASRPGRIACALLGILACLALFSAQASASGGTWWFSADANAGCSTRHLNMTYDGTVHTQGLVMCARPFTTQFTVQKSGTTIYQANESSSWTGSTYMVNRLKDFGACAHGNLYRVSMTYTVSATGRSGAIDSPRLQLC